MRVMTSQYETSGKKHIYSVNAQNPVYNIPSKEKKSLEQAEFWHEEKVVCRLPTPFLHSVRWFEHFGGVTVLLAGFLNDL